MNRTLEFIAERVKYYRAKRNLTLEELAEKSNLTKNYIWQIQQATANVSINKLESLASALNVDLLELLPGIHSNEDSSELILAKKINSLDEDNKELIINILRLASTLKNQRDLELIIDLLQSMHQK